MGGAGGFACQPDALLGWEFFAPCEDFPGTVGPALSGCRRLLAGDVAAQKRGGRLKAWPHQCQLAFGCGYAALWSRRFRLLLY